MQVDVGGRERGSWVDNFRGDGYRNFVIFVKTLAIILIQVGLSMSRRARIERIQV